MKLKKRAHSVKRFSIEVDYPDEKSAKEPEPVLMEASETFEKIQPIAIEDLFLPKAIQVPVPVEIHATTEPVKIPEHRKTFNGTL